MTILSRAADPPRQEGGAAVVPFPVPRAREKISPVAAKWLLLGLIARDPDADKPDLAPLVAFELLDRFDWERGNCYPSLDYLSGRVGRGETQTRKALRWLIERGYFARGGQSGYRTPFYWPDWRRIGATCPADSLRSKRSTSPRDSAPLGPPEGAENRGVGVRSSASHLLGIPHPNPESESRETIPSSRAGQSRPAEDGVVAPCDEDQSDPEPERDNPDPPIETLLRSMGSLAHCGARIWRPVVARWVQNFGFARVEAAITEVLAGSGTPEQKRARLAQEVERRLSPAAATDCDDEAWRLQLAIRAPKIARLLPSTLPRTEREARAFRALGDLEHALRISGCQKPRLTALARASAVLRRLASETETKDALWAALTAPADAD